MTEKSTNYQQKEERKGEGEEEAVGPVWVNSCHFGRVQRSMSGHNGGEEGGAS